MSTARELHLEFTKARARALELDEFDGSASSVSLACLHDCGLELREHALVSKGNPAKTNSGNDIFDVDTSAVDHRVAARDTVERQKQVGPGERDGVRSLS